MKISGNDLVKKMKAENISLEDIELMLCTNDNGYACLVVQKLIREDNPNYQQKLEQYQKDYQEYEKAHQTWEREKNKAYWAYRRKRLKELEEERRKLLGGNY